MIDYDNSEFEQLLRTVDQQTFRDSCAIVSDAMKVGRSILKQHSTSEPFNKDVVDVAKMIVDSTNCRLALCFDGYTITSVDPNDLQ